MITATHFILATIGVIAALGGLIALYFSWLRSDRSLSLVTAGWALMALSLILWAYAAGPDRGVAIGLIMICFLALILVRTSALNQERSAVAQKQSARHRKINGKPGNGTKWMAAIRGLGWILFLGPVFGLIAFAATMGFYEAMLLLQVSEADSLVSGLFLFPILWAALTVFWMISQRHRLKQYLLVLIPAFSAALIFEGNM